MRCDLRETAQTVYHKREKVLGSLLRAERQPVGRRRAAPDGRRVPALRRPEQTARPSGCRHREAERLHRPRAASALPPIPSELLLLRLIDVFPAKVGRHEGPSR
ncbi:hypothetical protein DIPPA_23630 [Diplonema papillatum]|nr:hypothetical protein DIPPA_23630 [Diplonema papillatum]